MRLEQLGSTITEKRPRGLWPSSTLTLRALGVELLDGVVEADADGGEAHLALQAGDQPAVEAAEALGAHHGQDGAQHPAVLGTPGRQGCLVLPLDLRDTPQSMRTGVGGGRGCVQGSLPGAGPRNMHGHSVTSQ